MEFGSCCQMSLSTAVEDIFYVELVQMFKREMSKKCEENSSALTSAEVSPPVRRFVTLLLREIQEISVSSTDCGQSAYLEHNVASLQGMHCNRQ